MTEQNDVERPSVSSEDAVARETAPNPPATMNGTVAATLRDTRGPGRKRTRDSNDSEAHQVVRRPSKHKLERSQNAPESATPHGSYTSYYRRRVDDRLPLLRPDWVRGKRVLDIGCNDGGVSIQLAAELAPAFVVGIDIDQTLVNRAKERLRTFGRSEKSRRLNASSEPGTTRSESENSGADFTQPSSLAFEGHAVNGNDNRRPSQESPPFPRNIIFRREDFASEENTVTSLEKEEYDLILMLSVTKWVHLHGGDDALRRLFCRARNCLRGGGVLILEPQLSISYKRARYSAKKCSEQNTSPLFSDRALELKPEDFTKFLVSTEGGFSRVDILRDVRQKGHPFNRPVFAVWK